VIAKFAVCNLSVVLGVFVVCGVADVLYVFADILG